MELEVGVRITRIEYGRWSIQMILLLVIRAVAVVEEAEVRAVPAVKIEAVREGAVRTGVRKKGKVEVKTVKTGV